MVDTFEKMDAINPTFDRLAAEERKAAGVMKIRFIYLNNLNHLFGLLPICLISQYPS